MIITEANVSTWSTLNSNKCLNLNETYMDLSKLNRRIHQCIHAVGTIEVTHSMSVPSSFSVYVDSVTVLKHTDC